MTLAGKAIGMLTVLSCKSKNVAIYVDMLQQFVDIKLMMKRVRRSTRMKVPRIFVKSDWKINNIP